MTKKDYGSMTIDELAHEAGSLEEVSSILKGVIGPIMEKMLQAEMDDHLGYPKHAREGRNSGNSRNGAYKKKITTTSGATDIEVPRDRNGDFDPKLLPKYETRTSEVEEKIINMYALGLTTTDIQAHVKDIYGANISPTLISSITDKIIPEIKEWQSKPLEQCYPILFLDAIHFKVKDGGIYKEKAVYLVIGISIRGIKELLGIYIGEAESASFWQTVCSDLFQRGIQDVFIACTDGLSGFSKAIKNIFPNTVIQKCIIHQIRNSLRHLNYKDVKAFIADLKNIYQAPNLEIAETNLLILEEKRGKKYSLAVKSWLDNRPELSTYFAYPTPIRKLIYTTNIIEGFNRQIRKYTKNRPSFPDDTALIKILYLVTQRITKKWTSTVHDWGSILNQFEAVFEGRVKPYLDL